jgi:hypothetical protein
MNNSIEIRLVKSDLPIKLIKQISVKRNLEPMAVIKMLSYNVLTPNQVAVITGRERSTIDNLISLNRKSKYEGLKGVFLFPDYINKKGRLFVLFDKLCLDYIKKCLDIND